MPSPPEPPDLEDQEAGTTTGRTAEGGEEPRPGSESAEAHYADTRVRHLSEELEDAYRRRDRREASDLSATTVVFEILDLKRRLRESGQLHAGDFLADRYKLLEMVGRGSYADVWRATDRESEEVVAVKVLHQRHAGDRARRRRYFRGVRQMARLRHPGIVEVFERHGEDEGWHFFVMEDLSGGDLREAISSRVLTPADRLRLVLEVGDALVFTHQRERAHRHVKPSNILFDAEGRPKLTDFDLVPSIDARTAVLGTILYAAPEVMQGAAGEDVKVDVYGLGMTTAFLLHGEDLPLEALRDASAFVLSLDAPETVLAALARAVTHDPEDRFDSVDAFCRELREGLSVLEEGPKPPADEVEVERAPALVEALTAVTRAEHRLSGVRFAEPQPDESQPTESRAAESRAAESQPDEPQAAATPGRAGRVAEVRERIHPVDGSVLVYVPGGELSLGADDLSEWEKPVHRVRLSPFWIGKYPVTNRQYRRFLKASPARPEPTLWDHESFRDDRQPVVGVSWDDAMTYCRWADLALPSEAQWEAAARGDDRRRYPWGDDAPTPEHANFGQHQGHTTAVDAHPLGEGPYGTFDQAGNVWEWCLDFWNPEAYERRVGQLDPVSTSRDASFRALRGGSWDDPPGLLTAAYRFWYAAWSRVRFVGFRCVLPAAGEDGSERA